MALIMHASALLALAAVANGQFSCPVAYDGKTNTPKCAGASDSTCSVATCCALSSTGKLCSSSLVSGNSKCKAGSDKNLFFDLKKSASAYLGSDDNLRTTCCTSCSKATCYDWSPLGTGCDLNTYFKPLTALASSDCTVPSTTKFKEGCCAVKAMCSSHTCSSGWTKRTNSDSIRCVGSSASCTDAGCCTATLCSATGVGLGTPKCKTGSDKNKFYDLVHKNSAVVVGTTDANFIASCCTSCSAATCADWQTVYPLVGCSSGQMISGTITLASSDCSIPSADKYKESCCIVTPSPPASMKCIDYVADTSTAFPKAFPVVGTWAGFMALVGAQVVFWA